MQVDHSPTMRLQVQTNWYLPTEEEKQVEKD